MILFADWYNTLKPTGQGKRGLGHITRSTIFVLCAVWEQYVEEVIEEAAALYVLRFDHPNELPERARLTLGRRVSGSKHELEPLNMAGNGWRDVYENAGAIIHH